MNKTHPGQRSNADRGNYSESVDQKLSSHIGPAVDRVEQALRDRGLTVQWSGKRFMAQCPAHNDNNPSLGVGQGDQRAIMKCYAGCDTRDVVAAIGLQMKDLFDNQRDAQYRYDGGRVVIRSFSQGGKKSFRQSNTKQPSELYQLANVQRAIRNNEIILIVEGEEDVNSVSQHFGMTATTSPMGAGAWSKVDPSPLYAAKAIVIVADNDTPGKAFAREVYDSLVDHNGDVTVAQAADGLNDITEHVLAGYGVADLVPVEMTPVVIPLARPTRFSSDDLLSMTFPPQAWVVDGILAEGLTMIAGAPKLGKSWMALEIAVCVASGRPAFGTHKVDQGEVLYLALEDTPRRLHKRLKVVEAKPGIPLTVDIASKDIGEGLEESVAEWIGTHPNAKLIVIDVFAKVRPRQGRSSNVYNDEYRDMSALKSIADEHAVALIVIHHVRKQTAEDVLDTVSGTNGLAGACDTVIVMARIRGKGNAKLFITGRDVEEVELPAKLADGRWSILDGTVEETTMQDSRVTILECLRSSGTPMKLKEIASATKLTYDNVKKTCQRMHKDGQIHGLGPGTYELVQVPQVSPIEAVPSVPVSPTKGVADSQDQLAA